MKKFGVMLGMVFFSLILVSCKEQVIEIENTVTLKHGEEVIEVLNDLEVGDAVELPVLEKEGLIFLGWDDEVNRYYDQYTFKESVTLEALFEEASEVFDIEIGDHFANITGYHGEASVLKIPTYIDGHMVRGIAWHAFTNDELVEVLIPSSIRFIALEAFYEMDSLKRVSFYGEYLGEEEMTIGNDDYQEFLSNFSDVCVKEEISERNWTFSVGCPIKEVVNHTDPVELNGKEIISYNVVMDLTYYDDGTSQLDISQFAFSDLPKLQSVSFPSRYRNFLGEIFEETPMIKDISFEDNDTYNVVDGVVYSEDQTTLVYYPLGSASESIEISEGVVNVNQYAFYQNQTTKYLHIPSTLRNELQFSSYYFYHYMKALESFEVDQENEVLYSVDGVLYGKDCVIDDEYHGLVFYPPMKEGTEYTVLDRASSIGPLAFLDQQFLEKIVLSEQIDFIGGQPFKRATSIQMIELPSSVEYIKEDFTNDSEIEQVIINRSILVDGSISELWKTYPPREYPNYYVPSDSLGAYLDGEGWREINEQIDTIESLELDSSMLYDYEIIDEEYVVITNYKGSLEYLKVPSSIEGYPVLEINADAFVGAVIKELYIPSSIELYDLHSLEEIGSLENLSFFDETGLID